MAGRQNWNRGGPDYYSASYGGMPQQVNYYMNSGGAGGGGRNFYNTPPVSKTYNRRDDRRSGPSRDERKRPRSPKNDRKRNNSRNREHSTYEVKTIKHVFGLGRLSLQELRHRISRASLPGDVTQVEATWTSSFPIQKPMRLSTDYDFHIFNSDVQVQNNFEHVATTSTLPDDLDYSVSVRVVILGTPSLGDMMKQSVKLADETASGDKVTPSKLFSFLMASRGKSDNHLFVGGPWSPSLDGPDPMNNPMTLIKIAVRYMKSQLGLDASSCTEWVRFLDIHYRRTAGSKAPPALEHSEARQVDRDTNESVVFLMPLMSNLMPSEADWESLKKAYGDALEKRLNPRKETQSETKVEEVKENGNETSSISPSKQANLDVDNMKVNELKDALTARGLDSKGLKNALVARLKAALEDESSTVAQAQVETKAEEPSQESTAVEAQLLESMEHSTSQPAAGDKTDSLPKDSAQEEAISEKEKRRLERIYRMPDKRCILLHPHAKSIDFYRVSLNSLLEHRPNTSNNNSNQSASMEEESHFELALFAHQYLEMLQRDAAFQILVAIHYHQLTKDLSPTTLSNTENGEPDTKKPHLDEGASAVRKHKRTPHPEWLFSFLVFDTGRAEFIKEHDLVDILSALDLGFSRNQLRKLTSKITKTGREGLVYRTLVDIEVAEGSNEDVVSLERDAKIQELIQQLASGHGELKGRGKALETAQLFLGGDATSVKRMKVAEESRKELEFQFHKLKEELQNTRVKMNSFQDVEDALKKELAELQKRHKTEQQTNTEQKHLVTVYGRLLKEAKTSMDRVLTDINRQFEKEERDKAPKQEELEDSKKQDDIVLDTA